MENFARIAKQQNSAVGEKADLKLWGINVN
jgi:hypothetical protein